MKPNLVSKSLAYKSIEILGHCMYQSIRHPRTKICQISNPQPVDLSPIPWWGCGALVVIGMVCWIVGEVCDIQSILEPARFLVYVPATHLFDRSVALAKHLPKK